MPDIILKYESFGDEVTSIHEINAIMDGATVGSLMWDETGEISWVEVHKDYRRRGIASQMWSSSQHIDPPARHSSRRSRLGNLWAHKVGGELPDLSEEVIEFMPLLDSALS